MGEMFLQNTLSGEKEPFVPLHAGEVRIYSCGPTVYDFAHIGNFRTFTFQDILRRFLRSQGYRVQQVMNLTDVDDRIIVNAAAANISIREYTDKFIAAFLEDMKALGLEMPEKIIRATDHIEEMVALIERLGQKGLTYSSDGSIYFRIAGFPEYGRLSKIHVDGMQAGVRVDADRYDKDNARDFALWKAPKPGEHFWETRIGPGRPGWHIECSAMAMKYLGETLDIHTGGVDLCFPHHENEIAQSEGATGLPFVRFWLHAEHLFLEGEKMSKSLGNFYTLRELLGMGYKPSTVRCLLASVPYRTQLKFTTESLRHAESAVERLRNFAARLKSQKFPPGDVASFTERARRAEDEFRAGLADDLNTARALAAVFDLIRDANTQMDRDAFTRNDLAPVQAALEKFDAVFDLLTDHDAEKLAALGLQSVEGAVADSEVEALVAERQSARQRRDFAASDRIRQQLAERGIILEDTRNGEVRWKRK